jgi:hypothetical protein
MEAANVYQATNGHTPGDSSVHTAAATSNLIYKFDGIFRGVKLPRP